MRLLLFLLLGAASASAEELAEVYDRLFRGLREIDNLAELNRFAPIYEMALEKALIDKDGRAPSPYLTLDHVQKICEEYKSSFAAVRSEVDEDPEKANQWTRSLEFQGNRFVDLLLKARRQVVVMQRAGLRSPFWLGQTPYLDVEPRYLTPDEIEEVTSRLRLMQAALARNEHDEFVRVHLFFDGDLSNRDLHAQNTGLIQRKSLLLNCALDQAIREASLESRSTFWSIAGTVVTIEHMPTQERPWSLITLQRDTLTKTLKLFNVL